MLHRHQRMAKVSTLVLHILYDICCLAIIFIFYTLLCISIHTDLLEGLKRAQRFRLEDQRGTEINFELPDFLKDNKTNDWNSAKLVAAADAMNTKDVNKKTAKAPQPTPRLSINRNNSIDKDSRRSSEVAKENEDNAQGANSSCNQGAYTTHSFRLEYSILKGKTVLIKTIN